MRPLLMWVARMALGFPLAVAHGFVLSRLWNWFIVPQFGAKPLGIVAAIGVTLTVGFIGIQWMVVPMMLDEKKKWVEDGSRGDVFDLVYPIVICGIVYPSMYYVALVWKHFL